MVSSPSFEEEHEQFFKEAKDKGLSSEKEKLKEIILQGHWTQEEEQQLKGPYGFNF